jgi:hypothetical protein
MKEPGPLSTVVRLVFITTGVLLLMIILMTTEQGGRRQLKQEHQALLYFVKDLINCGGLDDCKLKLTDLVESEKAKRVYDEIIVNSIKLEAQARAELSKTKPIYPPTAPASATTEILTPLLASAQPKPEWTPQAYMPDLNVVGLPKAGTSQLNAILSSHPETVEYGAEIELCACVKQGFRPIVGQQLFSKDDQLKVQNGLHTFFQTHPPATNGTKMTVSNCLSLPDSKYI